MIRQLVYHFENDTTCQLNSNAAYRELGIKMYEKYPAIKQ